MRAACRRCGAIVITLSGLVLAMGSLCAADTGQPGPSIAATGLLFPEGGVAILSPAGRLLKLVDVPSQHHTNLAISPDGRSLYVTAVDDDARSTDRGRIIRIANPLAP